MNSLDRHIRGWVVVVKGEGPAASRVFRCCGGEGCDPFQPDKRVEGRFVGSPKETEIDGMQIERQATDAEKTDAARLSGEVPAQAPKGDIA